MRRGKSGWLFGLLIILIGGVLGWWLGVADQVRSFSFNPFFLKNALNSKISKIENHDVFQGVGERAGSVFSQMVALPQKIASESISQLKQSVVQITKNETGAAIDALQARLGLQSAGGVSAGGISAGGVNEKPCERQQ